MMNTKYLASDILRLLETKHTMLQSITGCPKKHRAVERKNKLVWPRTILTFCEALAGSVVDNAPLIDLTGNQEQ